MLYIKFQGHYPCGAGEYFGGFLPNHLGHVTQISDQIKLTFPQHMDAPLKGPLTG